MGRLTQSTEEIQSILDSVQDKADKVDVVQPDWDATRGKAAVKNRPFGFNNPIRLSDADEIIDDVIDPDYDTHKITYKFLNWQFEGGLLMYVKGVLYDYNYEYEDYYYNRLYSGDYFKVRDYGDSAVIEVAFDGYNNDDNNYETIITITRDDMYDDVRNAIEEDVILAVDEVSLRTSLPDIFIPDSIARQESVLDLYEEASLLWDETSALWDETVSLNSEVSDIKGRVEELESGDGFDTKGVYPDLIAGDLAGRGESVPAEFSFRATGGKSIKDGRAYIKRIKGNSVVWNNMVDTRGYEGDFIIRDGVTIIAGHKYLLMREKADGYLHLIPVVDGTENYDMILLVGEYGKIYTSQYTDTTDARVYGTANMGGCIVSDLTKMFGAGNEPTTIEEYEARKPIVADEYAYNEGEVIHCNTESIKSVGDNAWDEQWEKGYIDSSSGVESSSDSYIRSKNFCRIIGGEDYYIIGNGYVIVLYDENYQWLDFWGAIGEPRKVSIDSRARYFKVAFKSDYGTTYKNDVLISLYHSGWKAEKDDQYQPYWQDTLPLPIIRKYFPQGMKSAGSACDEIRFNKASEKWKYSKGRINSVDLGTLSWYYDASLGGFYSDILVGAKKLFDGICAKYPFVGDYRNVTDKTCGYVYESCVLIKDSSYTDAASFKAAMQGVILYYESNDWEWVELDAEDQDFRDYYNVADFGTEQSQSSVPSAAFSADIIYQFNAVDMIREHELEITELQKVIATMQAQLISLTNK